MTKEDIIMKIIFLTNKCSHGAELLKAIKTAGIQISAIVIEKKTVQSMKKTLKRITKKGYRELFIFLLRKIKQQFIWKNYEEWRSEEYYHTFSDEVITVDNFNSIQCEQIIREIDPDIIVLGGSRILKNNIIKIPKIGILNAHPGLLPEYRGVDVIPWAIINGDDVGVSVHFIDAGIDTGKICVREKLPLMKNDTIQILRKRAETLAGELMAKTLQTIIKNGKCPTFPNPKEKGKQFYKMDSKTLKSAEKRLQERLKNVK